MTEYNDEEGLILKIKSSELCLAVTKLTWNWKNYLEPINEGFELMDKISKLSIELSDYDQRTKLSEYHRNKITNGIIDLETLLPFLKNKMELKIES